MFADDTTFQIFGKNIEQLFELANIELSKAATWFKSNKLTLNVSKTKHILFRKPNMKSNFNNLALNIENEPIERIGHGCKEESFKFVGHHLDEFLDWDHHITHIKNKLSKSNYIISCSKNFIPLSVRKLLYNSLFRSHLEFGIIAWGGVKSGKLKSIINLQKMCKKCCSQKF